MVRIKNGTAFAVVTAGVLVMSGCSGGSGHASTAATSNPSTSPSVAAAVTQPPDCVPDVDWSPLAASHKKWQRALKIKGETPSDLVTASTNFADTISDSGGSTQSSELETLGKDVLTVSGDFTTAVQSGSEPNWTTSDEQQVEDDWTHLSACSKT